MYIQKCRQVNLLPLAKRFDLNDLILFHKVVYNLIPLDLPNYLSYFNGISRLRSCHLDHLSFVCNLQPKNSSTSHLAKSQQKPKILKPSKKVVNVFCEGKELVRNQDLHENTLKILYNILNPYSKYVKVIFQFLFLKFF